MVGEQSRLPVPSPRHEPGLGSPARYRYRDPRGVREKIVREVERNARPACLVNGARTSRESRTDKHREGQTVYPVKRVPTAELRRLTVEPYAVPDTRERPIRRETRRMMRQTQRPAARCEVRSQ